MPATPMSFWLKSRYLSFLLLCSMEASAWQPLEVNRHPSSLGKMAQSHLITPVGSFSTCYTAQSHTLRGWGCSSVVEKTKYILLPLFFELEGYFPKQMLSRVYWTQPLVFAF
jgi:hypothetical protein